MNRNLYQNCIAVMPLSAGLKRRKRSSRITPGIASLKHFALFVLLLVGVYSGRAQAPYCSTPQLSCSSGDRVTVLTFASVTNNPICTTTGYGNYTTTVTVRNVTAGMTYPMTVETGYSGQDVGVWIDYDHSNTLDAGEYTSIGVTGAAGVPLTTNVSIPFSALGGPTRMRVANIWTFNSPGLLSSSNSCMTGYSSFGNVDDYTININPAGPPPCVLLPTTPVNGATSACSPSTVLSWPASAGATGYDVYLNAGTGTPTTLVSSNQATTTFTATTAPGPYVWRVIPRNSSGPATGNCAIWSFTTIPTVAADVTITAAPNDSVCLGSSVTFTATTANAGTTPLYQWRRNTAIVGSNSPSYSFTPTIANNGEVVTLILTSNGACVSPNKDTSNPITLTVLPRPNPIISATASSICQGDAATLTAAPATGLTYQWLLNNNIIPGATAAAYSATLAGSYRVLAANGICADTSAPFILDVRPLPVVTTTPAGNQSFCSNTTLTIAAFSATGYTYQWNNGGLPIPGETGQVYLANASGSYSVTATFNGCTATSAPVNATRLTAPAATITAGGPVSFCAPGSVVLSANTGTGLTYQWRRNGSPITPAATGSTYTATVSGAYTVVVSNTNCPATSNTINVTASTLPSATVNTVGTTTFCLGSSVTFQAAFVTGYTYQWYRNSTAIPGATQFSYQATTAGAYYVVITNGACVRTTTPINVTVNALPVAVIASTTGATAFCAGGSVTFTANAGAGLTYQWRRNNLNIAGETGISYTATTSGVYQVTVSNGICPATSAGQTVVVSTPVAATITPQGATNFCNLNSVVLRATQGGSLTYQWLKDNVLIPGATSADYTAAASGNYRVIVTNGTCVDTSAPQAVAVTPAPPAIITPSGALNFCQGGMVTLTANSAPGFQYQWTLNGVAVAGDTTNRITVTTTGDYAVNIFDGFCPATSATARVVVNPVPVVGITVAGDVLTATAGFAAYQWYRNGAAIDGATQAAYTATVAGYYTVVVSDNIGCSATSAVQNLTSLAVGNVGGTEESVRVYPNPARGVVRVDADGLVDLVLSTVDGREALRAEKATSLDLSPLADGMYLLRITDHKTGRLIKIEKLTKSNR